MLPGSGIFTSAVERGVAPHTRKQRVLAAISKLRSAFFTGYKNKILHVLYIIYIYIRGSQLNRHESVSLASLARQIIGERAKRARHSRVCSIENRGLLYIVRANVQILFL